jgi:(4S)-4-hydroxy-5-phosphonooxypentane-2,3-dione isomerase
VENVRYHVVTAYDLHSERVDEFVQVVIGDARTSLAQESGTRRFDITVDDSNSSRVYLDEVYDDRAAFSYHLSGSSFAAFDRARRTLEPIETPLIRGTIVDLEQDPDSTFLLPAYQESCNSYHAIDDFRTKLLGFLPLVTGGGLIFLSGRTEDVREEFFGAPSVPSAFSLLSVCSPSSSSAS